MGANGAGKGDHVEYYTIPILLVILAIALVGLIYWGASVEEKRNARVKAR